MTKDLSKRIFKLTTSDEPKENTDLALNLIISFANCNAITIKFYLSSLTSTTKRRLITDEAINTASSNGKRMKKDTGCKSER